MDLATLEYPRHLHKTGGAYLLVASSEEAAAAIKDGWSVEVPLEKTAEASDARPGVHKSSR